MKKKKSTAQDLIDSLLDDPRDGRPSSAKAPPLPGELAAGGVAKPKSLADAKAPLDVRFELDPDKSVDASLKLVGAETSASAREDHTRKAQATAVVAPAPTAVADEPDLSPSEVRNAPTLVVNKGKKRAIADVDELIKVDDASLAPDQTMRLQDARKSSSIDRKGGTEVRFGVGQMGSGTARAVPPPSGAVFTSAEASLKQSESLRIAQMRIHELEQELDRLRRDNEKLGSAGETLRRRADELLARAETLEIQSRESQKIHDEEKKVLRGQLSAKERESIDLRAKLEETESRLEGNFKRIRVRERELEHRLEIVKMESTTLVATKDEMIMRLKREIDQLKFETDNGKVRSQELYNQYKEKQETIGRVVRALRIALTILEGDDGGQKKGEE